MRDCKTWANSLLLLQNTWIGKSGFCDEEMKGETKVEKAGASFSNIMG